MTTKPEHERMSGYKYNPDDLIIVGLDTEDGPEHDLYDPSIKEKLDPGFVADIEAQGVHTPIKVTGTGDKLYVVIGRKRVRALREINKRLAKEGVAPVLVPGIRTDVTGLDLLKMVASENIHRGQLTMMAKAELMQRLIERGDSEEGVKTTLGVTGQTIKNWKALLAVTPAVRKVFEKTNLPPTALLKVAALPAEEQKAAIEEVVKADGKGSAVQAAARAARTRKAAKKGSKKKAKDIEGHQAPSKRAWIRLLDNYEDVETLLGTDGLNVVKVMLGRVGVSKIAGLAAAIKEVSGGKAA